MLDQAKDSKATEKATADGMDIAVSDDGVPPTKQDTPFQKMKYVLGTCSKYARTDPD